MPSARIGTLTLTGASGREYDFLVYPAGHVFPATFQCVYYLSHRVTQPFEEALHKPVYLGETADFNATLGGDYRDHPRQACLEQHGVNAVSVFITNNEAQRREVGKDLLEALQPVCNL